MVGAVTQPWALVVQFRGLFAEPDFTKIVWSTAVRPGDPGFSVLSTETRVAATDPISRRRFRRYWFVAGLGVRLIRIVGLRLVKRDLDRGSGTDRKTIEPLTSSRV